MTGLQLALASGTLLGLALAQCHVAYFVVMLRGV